MRRASIPALFIFVLLASPGWAADEEMLRANVASFQGALSLKDYDSAERYLKEAMRLGEELYGPRDPRVALMTGNLAETYLAADLHRQALITFEKAQALYDPQTDDGRRGIIRAVIGRAKARPRADDSPAAGRLYAEAEDKAEAWFGKDSRELADAKVMRADYIYLSPTPDATRMKRLYDDAADIYRKIDGESSPELVHIYHQYGKVRLAMDNARSAIEYFDRALGVLKTHKQRDRELMVRATMIQALDKIGDEERCIAETELFAVLLGEGDRKDAKPLVRVPPSYPVSAAQMGTQGWVQFTYGINKHGHVVNPTVVKADPPGVFEKSALKAFEKWRYAPKVIGGQTVDSDGYEIIITYDLQNR
ncbi:MAG: TonB family protein [Rhodospirillaceae bacterium]|nr:TonB family protein [Rhodospirillaceae bacterium]